MYSFSLLVPFLKHQNPLLTGAACSSIGLIGRVCSLPLEDGKPLKNGSPDAKRPASDNITKIDIVNQLLDIMNNTKLSAKIREKAAKSLGLLCVGEEFCHTREVIRGLVNTAKEVRSYVSIGVTNICRNKKYHSSSFVFYRNKVIKEPLEIFSPRTEPRIKYIEESSC